MNKEQLKLVLEKMNLPSHNCYPKKSFMGKDKEGIFVGLFEHEFEDDFYFLNLYSGNLYMIVKEPKFRDVYEENLDSAGKTKWLVPIHAWNLIEVDRKIPTLTEDEANVGDVTTVRPRAIAVEELKIVVNNSFNVDTEDVFTEVEDANMNTMTLRDYACIKLAVPSSRKRMA